MQRTGSHAGHFIEKSRLFHLVSRKINLKLLADPTYPIRPKNFGQKLRKKRMDLGLQIKELAKYFGVNQDTIINWELRNVKTDLPPLIVPLSKLESRA